MTKQFQEQWEEYDRRVIPLNAPPTQRREMRRAFYAGAVALFSLVQALGDEDISEEAGAKALEALQAELESFLSQVGTRY